MKHLQETPVPPSRRRPADLADEVPPELDMIVLRALGKEPPERYQSAEDFDADLRRAAGGLGVAPETEEAATSILSRTEATVIRRAPAPPAPTIPVTTRPQAPYRPPTYYDYDEPPRRRAIWPWLLGILLIASALVAGFYLYSQIQEQLKDTTTASVPFVEGLAQQAAENQIREAELEPKIVEEEHETVPKGQVIRQDPSAGLKIDKGSIVTLTVSSGKPKTDVPDVRGKTLAEAASQLATAGLQVKPVQVPSDEEAGVVTAQDPKPGTSVVEGTTVRINVSKGPELIAVPTVVGEPYENALGRLQGLRFFVGKREVVADAARGIVVDQSPPAGTLLPEGSQVTLTVSKGPKTNAVPDVTSQTEDAGRATVRAAGFAVQVTYENVTDPTQDGLVLFQTPEGGTQAKPGSRVTLVVGRLLEEEEPPPPTTAPTTTAPVP
jgi:serine/threonine-protein kinase